MNDNNASRHALPDLDDRQAAERKLCRLFDSFGIDALLERERLIDPYLERARAYWRPHGGSDLAMLAAEEAEDDLDAWFKTLLGDRLDDGSTAVMTGRAAFLMCRGPKRFAHLLLQPVESLPEAFVSALLDQAPCPVPAGETGEMHHQPYEAWSPIAFLTDQRSMLQSLGALVRRDA